MRTFIIICFFMLSKSTIAQKYALIDRDYKKPILFTDSVTMNQVSNNYFPVRVTDLDSLVANINYLTDQIKSIQRSKFSSFKLKSGNTSLQINSIAHAYGDTYDITFLTIAGNLNAQYLIADNKQLNRKAIKNLNSFISYIKKDKEIVINVFKEYTPVLYDATVYIGTRN